MTYKELYEMGFADVKVFADYDGCLIGVSTKHQAIYSLARMVEWVYENHNCSVEEAYEYVENNTLNSMDNSIVVFDDL